MRFRVITLACSLGLALVCGVAVSRAQTEAKVPHGRALEMNEFNSREALTNLIQLNRNSGLRQLEEDSFSKSFKPFSPRGSLDGIEYMPPPQMPVVRSRKLKDELEKRKNWMYLSPDDLLPGREDADLMKSLDGSDKQPKKTPLDQFYERLEKEQKSFGNLRNGQRDDPLSVRDPFRDDSKSQDESKLPGGIRDSAQNLRKLLEDENANAPYGAHRSSVSDIFGLGGDRNGPTREDLEKHKAYMEEYRKVLGGNIQPLPTVFDPFKAAATPTAQTTYGNLNPLVTPAPRTGMETTLGTLGTILNPGLLPDQNAKVLNQWNPFYNPQPKVEAPKPVPLNIGLPEAPRRRF